MDISSLEDTRRFFFAECGNARKRNIFYHGIVLHFDRQICAILLKRVFNELERKNIRDSLANMISAIDTLRFNHLIQQFFFKEKKVSGYDIHTMVFFNYVYFIVIVHLFIASSINPTRKLIIICRTIFFMQRYDFIQNMLSLI